MENRPRMTPPTVADCLRGILVDPNAVASVESDGPYIAVNVRGEAFWLVLVPEERMHDIEIVLGTRKP